MNPMRARRFKARTGVNQPLRLWAGQKSCYRRGLEVR